MASKSGNQSEWNWELLREEAPELRRRLNQFRLGLGRHFVAKQPLIDAMLVAAIAQEPLLIVGPPGTAKSDLVVKFAQALGVDEQHYFEYMLTRFTEPSEIVGPIDINQLREGRYLRREQGKLPTAQVAFLDEIFKSNSAILNILLTIINERKFYQDGKPQPVELKILFAATNDLPEHGELAALKDRFVLKVPSRPVADSQFEELIQAGLANEVHRALNRQPWQEGLASLQDVLKAHRYLSLQFARSGEEADRRDALHDSPGETDRERFFPRDVFREFRRIVRVLLREDRIQISDRKIIKLYKLFRARAWLLSGGTVSRDDLQLLQFLGDSQDEIELLARKVPLLLEGPGSTA